MTRSLLVVWVSLMALSAEPAQAAGGGIEILPDPARLLPLIALFVLMIVPVNHLIVKPLLSVLDEREARIAGSRQRAEELGQRAGEVLAGYEASVARAREEAETSRRSTLDEARTVHAERVASERGAAEQRTAEARREIAVALEQARTGLRTEAEALARQTAERMLGRSL